MDLVYWTLLPFVVATGSAVLGSIVTRARFEVLMARDREALAEARTTIAQFHKTMEERVKASEAEVRRKALDEFLADVRVEERQFLRERRTASALQKSLVLQERIYFRNIPLSNWIEHETTVAEGGGDSQEPVLRASPARKLLR